jgi:hypothetical protein
MEESGEGQQEERQRDSLGRFIGERTNVEDVPRLPTFPARWVLEDPRGRPYLVSWEPRGVLSGHGLKMEKIHREDAVRVTTETGATRELTLEWRAMPRGSGRALFYRCPGCDQPRRCLYRLPVDGFVGSLLLRCQRCAKLTFECQGQYVNAVGRLFRDCLRADGDKLPRDRWDPRAFSDPRLAPE